MERARPQNTNIYCQEDAEQIWSEAAKLQSQAQNRLEERSKAISHRVEESDAHASWSGFDDAEIRDIAEEAGISSEFVDMAVLKAKSGSLTKTSQNDKSLIQKLAGIEELGIERSMTFDMPLEKVYNAMKRILPSQKYNLELSDVIGDGSPEDTVLGFTIPNMMNPAGTVNNFAYKMSYTSVKRIYASIHAISEEQCQVTLRAEQSHKSSSSAYFFLSLFFALFISIAVWPIGLKVLDLDPITQILPLYIIASGLLTKGFLAASKSMHRWGVRKTGDAVQELLQAIKVDAITEGSFSKANESPALPNLFGTNQLI